MNWWYLSFVDTEAPEGERWLGACIVRAMDPMSACTEAWRLKINPGGEVLCREITPDLPQPPIEWCEQLLTRAEVDAMDQVLSEQLR